MASCSLAVDGDREPGWRLRPGLGGEPEATPEPAVREQVAQPLDAQPNQADPARAGAGPRRGRGAQPGRRQAKLVRILDPGAERQHTQARPHPRPGCGAPAPTASPRPAPASAARPGPGRCGASAATASPSP